MKYIKLLFLSLSFAATFTACDLSLIHIYERAYNNETHHHMICTECGKVTEFQDENLKQAIRCV